MLSIKWTAGLIALLTLILLQAGGCASTPNSDIPWNVPQPWENSPAVPGLSQ